MTPITGGVAGVLAPMVLVSILNRVFFVRGTPGGLGLFAAGAAAAFIALITERVLWAWFDPVLPAGWALVIRAFLMIGLVEELAKTALIYAQLSERRAISWRRYAIVAAWIGAGFAGAENCLYILSHGGDVVFIRTFTATPFHVLNAVVAARLLWVGANEGHSIHIVAAVVLAALLHGLYDYLIFTDQIGGGAFWFALMLTATIALALLCQPDEAGRASSS